MESTLEDPRTCYFSFLSASKLARSGPTNDIVVGVGNLTFETFKLLCIVQIVFRLRPDCIQTVFRLYSDCIQTVSRLYPDCIQIVSRLYLECIQTVFSRDVTSLIFASLSSARS